jgi:putative ABC transport system permease protein
VIRRPVHDSSASRLSRQDLLRVGSLGLRSRRMRAALSALGISIGIAAIVGVLGISQSSKTGLLNELGQLGNLISVQAQNTGLGQPTELPVTAEGMTSRIGPVISVTQIGGISNVYVYRNPLVPASDTSGISLTATRRRPARRPRGQPGARHLPQRGHRPLPGGRPRCRDGQPAWHR